MTQKWLTLTKKWEGVDADYSLNRFKQNDVSKIEAKQAAFDLDIKKVKGMKKASKIGMEVLGAAFGPLADIGLGFLSDMIFGDPYQQQIDQLNGRIDKVMTCMGALVQKLDKKIEENRDWIRDVKNLVDDKMVHDAVNALKQLEFESLNIKVCEDVRSVKKHPLLADTFVRCDVVSEKEKCSLMWVHECDLDMTGSGDKQMGKDMVTQLFKTQNALSKLMEHTKVAIYANRDTEATVDKTNVLRNSQYIIKILQAFNDVMVPYLIIAKQRGYYLSRNFFQDHFQTGSDYNFVKWYSDMAKKLLVIHTQTRTKFLTKPGSKCMAPSADGKGKSEPLRLTIDLGDASGKYTFLVDKCRAICLDKGWCVGVETQLSRKVKRFICKLVTSVDEMGYKLANVAVEWKVRTYKEKPDSYVYDPKDSRPVTTPRPTSPIEGDKTYQDAQNFSRRRRKYVQQVQRGDIGPRGAGRRNLHTVTMMDGTRTDRYGVKERVPKPGPFPCGKVPQRGCNRQGAGPGCVGGGTGEWWMKVPHNCKRWYWYSRTFKSFPLDITINALGTTFTGELSCGSSDCSTAGNTLKREIDTFAPVNSVRFGDESGTECHVAPSIKRFTRQCNIPADFLDSLTPNDDVDSVLEAKKNNRGELYVGYPWDFEHCALLCEKNLCSGFAVNYNYKTAEKFACFVFTDNTEYTDSTCSTVKINNGVDNIWEFYTDLDATPLTKSTYYLNEAYDLSQAMFYALTKDREQMISWGQMDNIFVDNGNEQVLCPATHYTRYSKVKSVIWGDKNMFNCWNLQDVNSVKNAEPFCRIGCESGVLQKSCAFWTPIGNQKGSWAPCSGNAPGSLCMIYATDHKTDNRAGWNTLEKAKKYCQAWPECVGYWKEDDTHYWAMNQRDLLAKNLMKQGQGAFVCSDQDTRRDPVEDKIVSSLAYKAVEGNVYAIERLEGRIDTIPIILKQLEANNIAVNVPAIDPCARNGGKGPCQDTCTNNEGKYVCSCTAPWFLNPDKLSCSCPSSMYVIDGTCSHGPCAEDNGGCEDTCTTTIDVKAKCSCTNKDAMVMQLNSDKKTCSPSFDVQTQIKWCSGKSLDLGDVFGAGLTGACAYTGSMTRNEVVIKAMLTCKTVSNCEGFTYYPEFSKPEVCFRSDTSDRPWDKNSAAICYSKKTKAIKKIGNFECRGSELRMFEGNGDNKGSYEQKINNCKMACLTRKDPSREDNYKKTWEGFGNTMPGFIMTKKGRCYCEAQSSKTCSRYGIKGSYYRWDFEDETTTSEEQVMDSFTHKDKLLNRLVELEEEIAEKMDMEDEELLAELLSQI